MLNKVLLIGRLGGDPKRCNGQSSATTFSLASRPPIRHGDREVVAERFRVLAPPVTVLGSGEAA